MTGESPFRGNRGSVTVVTMTVILFASILALVFVDLLRALASRSTAQTAADAAALAAAQEMARPSGMSPAVLAAEFARRNGATLIDCRCDRRTTAAIVTVEVPVNILFVGSDRDVQARARAVVESSGAGGA
ncbi:MAG TPA: Rv3654c family TadE-like protein [Actinomycetota bacterium]|nr:Rv3654c family TadE-like protein [Actinomycetota bacterium]